MNRSTDHATPVKYRVANFTKIELSLNSVLRFDLHDVRETAREIRMYADLPYVYLLKGNQMKSIIGLLKTLQSTRSTCFPYALFLVDESERNPGDAISGDYPVDVFSMDNDDPDTIADRIKAYARTRFVFDSDKLKYAKSDSMPQSVDVLIVGAGVTGLYAADRFLDKNISFCLVDKRDIVGGIWSNYANTTSQVNTSESAYRLIEKNARTNSDHSSTREILEDIAHMSQRVSDKLFLNATVDWIEKKNGFYQSKITRFGEQTRVTSKGVILAVNDRIGEPRKITWQNEANFQGETVSGLSDGAKDVDWKGKKVVVVGMGAFAVENARTALEGGARHVTVVCRRHGTVCPKIIDYLNFSTPYDENFEHDKKSNMRNMILWKKLYDQSGATQPECWMGKIKHTGHTISVSDIWFIGHYLKKIATVTGSITGMSENGVIVENEKHVEADVVVNCVGFHRNGSAVKGLFSYGETYNNNYVDKDLMYLADAFIDDDVFNSFFGSSVLEMAKFYIDVYIAFFDNPEFDDMMRTDGIEKNPMDDRKWSNYIAGAVSLMNRYPDIRDIAGKQVKQRTRNFLESHDIDTYISQNKREWIDTHSLLAGKVMKEEDCLPYVFQKLSDKKI